jgi:hypothetical protein
MSSSIKTEPGAAFTPGPWEVFFPTDPDACAVRPGIDAISGPTLILWGTDEDGEGVYGETPEQAKANARLIAAAPELYEALKKIADESVFNQQRFAEDDDAEYFLRCFRAVKKCARAALAKAEASDA